MIERWLYYTILVVVLVIAALWAVMAMAQDDPLHTGHTHQGDVGQFYQTWPRPLDRSSSCCGNQDCRPILQMRKHPGGKLAFNSQIADATWEVLIYVPWDRQPEWMAVADMIWEDARPDPRESPDGHSHACVTYSGYVICAVRASGQ